MERLTKRIGQHVYYTQGKYEDTLPVEMETNNIRSVFKKLAEYEDLEEQISNKFADCIDMKTILDAFCAFYDMQEIKEELAQCALLTNEEVLKYRQWKDAEEQGLLHKAPLKDGTPIFVIRTDWEDGDEVCEDGYLYGVTEYMVGEINKNYWLTKEEAEQALAELKGD